MAAARVGPRLFADRKTVVDMPPVLRCGVRRIDPERIDRVDRLQHLLDLRPSGLAQQALPAGTHERHGQIAFTRSNGPQDVDAGDDGPVVVRGPADEREDAARREGHDAPLSIDHMLFDDAAEADPVLDALLEPCQLDMSEVAHAAPPAFSGNSRDRRSRSMSATVTPRWNAATLMRPRSSGVTSIVSRAVKRSAFAPLFGRGSGVRTQASGSLGRSAKARC